MATTKRHSRAGLASLLAVALVAAGSVATSTPAGAVPTAELSIDQTSLNLGPVAPGGVVRGTVHISNVGTAPLTGLANGDPTDPRFSAANACPASLPAGSGCSLDVAFAPPVGPATATGTVDVMSSAGTRTVHLSGTADTPTFPIEVGVSGLDFGEVPIGSSSAPQPVTLTNVTTAPVSPKFGLSFLPDPPFFQSSTCTATPMAPGASCAFRFRFSPTKTGYASTTHLVQLSVGGKSRSVNVELRGHGMSNLRVSGTLHDFGEVKVGFGSTQSLLTEVTNTGAVSTRLTVSGESASGAFHAVDGCSGVAMAPGASCTISYSFGPTSATPSSLTDDLVLTDGARHLSTPVTVHLSGKGVSGSPFPLVTSSTGLDFGTQLTGSPGVTHQIVVSNMGSSDVALGLSGLQPDPNFPILGNGCGATLASGSSCSVFYVFRPDQIGTYGSLSTLTLTADGSSRKVTVVLWGVALTPVLVSPYRFDFGTTPIGVSAPVFETVLRNLSPVSLVAVDGVSAGLPFLSSTDCGNGVPAGGTCKLDLSERATSTAAQSQTIAIGLTPNSAAHYSVDLAYSSAGGAPTGAKPFVGATSLDAGLVKVGGTRQVSTVVANTSSASIPAPMLAVPPDPRFTVADLCGPVPPADTCRVTYTLHGSMPGDVSTTATISAGGHSTTVHLHGVVVAAPHAGADAATAMRGVPYQVTTVAAGLLANDTGRDVFISAHTNPAHGTLAVQTDGRWSYLSSGYVGPDSFTYTVTDAVGQTSTATVAITVRANTANEAFVRSAFADFLGRAPTANELSTDAGGLDAGTLSRGTVVSGLASSSEWVSAVVNQFYLDTLGRPGDAGGVAYWTNRIRTGASTPAQVAAEFYASDEYFHHTGGTNQAWVTAVYHALLGRAPDSAGLAYWTGQVAATGRAPVAFRLYQSSESCHTRVRKLYQKLLARLPDPGGADYWATQVADHGDIALAANLAASTEYFNRSQTRFP
ncbi:MAG: choice-of-anchor protein [Acidimicrobiales bacterium]|nr:choice-of-anchor protein [Acidimicrobiales bacterium]